MRTAITHLALMLLLLAGCGSPPEPASPAEVAAPVEVTPPAAAPPAPAPAEEPAPPAPAGPVSIQIRVVDLEGEPLANMAPIVTRQPNAFDTPLATGTLTDWDGRGSVTFDVREKVCVRAWDPQLGYFPNNFYEVLPRSGNIDEVLEVVMVKGAGITFQLFDPSGAIVADEPIALMLSHPTRGPWWPAEAETGPDGRVTFTTVPAGEFLLDMQTRIGLRIELPVVPLPPGVVTDLGRLTLQ